MRFEVFETGDHKFLVLLGAQQVKEFKTHHKARKLAKLMNSIVEKNDGKV